MKKKIILAGGTGFVGKYLQGSFQKLDYEVIIIARSSNCVQWQDEKSIISALENAAMLINLAGKSVDCRYNEKNKAEILSSRTETTQILGNALLKCQNPPELWINSSTATIYRHAQDHSMTEDAGEIGNGFSVEVAKAWEKAFFNFQLPQTRQIVLRMAIVLGKGGGVMTPFKNLVRFGLGGKQGDGKQMFSWLHLEDLKNMVLFFQTRKDLKGVYNCSSPYPIDNDTLMKTLREVMKVKFGLPSPKFLLEIGAILIRTETELILKSRWVVPQKLLAAGFQFKYERLQDALTNILRET